MQSSSDIDTHPRHRHGLPRLYMDSPAQTGTPRPTSHTQAPSKPPSQTRIPRPATGTLSHLSWPAPRILAISTWLESESGGWPTCFPCYLALGPHEASPILFPPLSPFFLFSFSPIPSSSLWFQSCFLTQKPVVWQHEGLDSGASTLETQGQHPADTGHHQEMPTVLPAHLMALAGQGSLWGPRALGREMPWQELTKRPVGAL